MPLMSGHHHRYAQLTKAVRKANEIQSHTTTTNIIATEDVSGHKRRTYWIVHGTDQHDQLHTAVAQCARDGRPAHAYQVLWQPHWTDIWIDIEWYDRRHVPHTDQLQRVMDDNVERVRAALPDGDTRVPLLACASGWVAAGRYKCSWHALLRPPAQPSRRFTFTHRQMRDVVIGCGARDADPAVYNTGTQNWRMPYCTKAADGAARALVIMDHVRRDEDTGAWHGTPVDANAPRVATGMVRPAQVTDAEGAPDDAPSTGPAWAMHVLRSRLARQFKCQPNRAVWRGDGQRFWVVPVRGAASGKCPIAARRHRSNNAWLQFDNATWHVRYRCHSARCNGRCVELPVDVDMFNELMDMHGADTQPHAHSDDDRDVPTHIATAHGAATAVRRRTQRDGSRTTARHEAHGGAQPDRHTGGACAPAATTPTAGSAQADGRPIPEGDT